MLGRADTGVVGRVEVPNARVGQVVWLLNHLLYQKGAYGVK